MGIDRRQDGITLLFSAFKQRCSEGDVKQMRSEHPAHDWLSPTTDKLIACLQPAEDAIPMQTAVRQAQERDLRLSRQDAKSSSLTIQKKAVRYNREVHNNDALCSLEGQTHLVINLILNPVLDRGRRGLEFPCYWLVQSGVDLKSAVWWISVCGVFVPEEMVYW